MLLSQLKKWSTYLKLFISIKHASKVVRSFTEGRVIPLASLAFPHGLRNAPWTSSSRVLFRAKTQPEDSAGKATSAQNLMVRLCERNDTDTPRIRCCASPKRLKPFCARIRRSGNEMTDAVLSVVKWCIFRVRRVRQRWRSSSDDRRGLVRRVQHLGSSAPLCAHAQQIRSGGSWADS